MQKVFKLNQIEFAKLLKTGLSLYNFKKKQDSNFFYYFSRWKGTTLSLYENGTLLLQGSEKNLQLFLEKNLFLLKKTTPTNIKKKISFSKNDSKSFDLPYFGCDESGLGDLFGPLVLTIFYLDANVYSHIKHLPIQDSKKMTNTQILQIAPKLMLYAKNFHTKIVSNQEFNQVFAKKMNLKELLSFYYAQIIKTFVSPKNHIPIIIDGYTTFQNFYKHYQKLNFFLPKKLYFFPKAEVQFLAVAVASIISRYFFLKEIAKISQTLHIPVLLGASNRTKFFLKKLIEKHGLPKMENFIKKNYKYTV